MKRIIHIFSIVFFMLCCTFVVSCDWENIASTSENYSNVVSSNKIAKKGVSVSRYDDGSDKSAMLLEDLGISWYYNWSANDFANNINAEFVPMIWGEGNVNTRTLNSIRTGYEQGKYKYLLTFNEPDADTQGVSSGISVQRALDLWPQLEKIGIPLSSPAPTSYSTGWLDEFMEGAIKRNYRVDFIALHCYQNFADENAVAELRDELIRIYEKYRRPIWITEFAAIDIWVWGGHSGNPACTLDAALSYTQNVTDMLESLGFVERYAWFIDNTNSPTESRLKEAKYTYLYNNDDTISETGEVYKAQMSSTPLEIVTTLNTGKVGERYRVQLKGSGGSEKYTFSSSAPDGVREWSELPDGFSINSSGVLSGTPHGAGTFDICVSLEDSEQQMTFKYYKLVVEE
ncbi:MAG: hypothetical protein J1F32_03530 [Erysipelotrichales bacterium]|nr:hypothetical protein [Erysipelotrichales bacterium]